MDPVGGAPGKWVCGCGGGAPIPPSTWGTSGYTPQASPSTAAPASASAPYMAITSHVIVQASDPYYKSMVAAYHNYLGQCPACSSAANGSVSQQGWFWGNACHWVQDQGDCNPRFFNALASVSITTPTRSDQVFLVSAAVSGGFAEAGLTPDTAAAEDGGPSGSLYGPFHRRPGPQTNEEVTLARNNQLTQLQGSVNRGGSFRSADAHLGHFLRDGRVTSSTLR